MTVERTRELSQQERTILHTSALVVLLARAGGSMTFTEDEYAAAQKEHGEIVHLDLSGDGRSHHVAVRLARRTG